MTVVGGSERLLAYLAEIEDLRGIGEQLYWDMTTHLPAGSVRARGRQSALIEREIVRRTASVELEELLSVVRGEQLDEATALVVATAERDLRSARAQPAELLAEFSSCGAEAVEVWRVARRDNDWSSFAPWLQRLVDINRRIAEHIGYRDHPLDALLSLYEPGPSKAQVDSLVDGLREPLRRVAASRLSRPPIIADHPEERQGVLQVVREIGTLLGFDYDRGAVGESSHPATSSAGAEDVRITVRTEVPFSQVISSAVHEFGHAIYDQGIDPRFWSTPVGRGSMPYLHESQSKFFENHLLREPGFVEWVIPVAERHLGISLDSGSFRSRLNDRDVSLIRINSDEIGFMLHIIMRWEIECALLSGELAVADLPRRWNELSEHYLGLVPDTDSEGCLQDPHWCHRYMGLFAGYLVGSIAAAQMWSACARDGVSAADGLAAGDLGHMVAWLRAKVHGEGRAHAIDTVLQKMSLPGLDTSAYTALVLERPR